LANEYAIADLPIADGPDSMSTFCFFPFAVEQYCRYAGNTFISISTSLYFSVADFDTKNIRIIASKRIMRPN
jgi:hypothetical protein